MTMGLLLAAFALAALFFAVKMAYRCWRTLYDHFLERKRRRLEVRKLSIEVRSLEEQLRQSQRRFDIIECQGFAMHENREDLRLRLSSSLELEKIRTDHKNASIETALSLLEQLKQVAGSDAEQAKINELIEASNRRLQALNDIGDEQLDGRF